MDTDTSKNLYVPALSILAGVLVLLVLIGISTFRNVDRHKQAALHMLQQQGMMLIHSLEASLRSGIVRGSSNSGSLSDLIAEIARNEDIAYISIVGRDGRLLHHTGWAKSAGDRLPRDYDWNGQGKGDTYRHPEGAEIFEIAKPLDLVGKEGGGRGQDHHGEIIVLGMKMTLFEEALRADLHHAGIMAFIVVALGTGTIFFIFVIRKYYLVNRTLEATRDYTQQVISSLATGLVSIDARGMVRSFNEPALNLLGISADEIQARAFDTVLDFAQSGIDHTLANGRSILDKEIHYRSPDAVSTPMAVSVTPIRDPDGIGGGAVIVLRDLTEIKRMEAHMRRSEKLAAVGALAASVAHEIRNPLSSIRGFAQFLWKRSPAGSPEMEYTHAMIKEVDRINTVVGDLLTFARPMQANPQLTDVSVLIAHVIRLVHQDAEEKKITIESLLEPGIPPVCLDAGQMTQALLNLLLNAVSAIDQGGHIAVVFELDEKARSYTLSVQDDGPGIDEDIRDRVFDPFFTTREKGTGLGLAIVRKIVEHNGGKVSIQCPPPDQARGCRVAMQMPVNAGCSAAVKTGK